MRDANLSCVRCLILALKPLHRFLNERGETHGCYGLSQWGIKSVLLNSLANNHLSQHGHLVLTGDSSWSGCIQPEDTC